MLAQGRGEDSAVRENALDEETLGHGSGVTAPGTNVKLTTELSF